MNDPYIISIIRKEKRKLIKLGRNIEDYGFYWGDAEWILLEEYFGYACGFTGFGNDIKLFGNRHFHFKGGKGLKIKLIQK